jgi:hypothetical protein
MQVASRPFTLIAHLIAPYPAARRILSRRRLPSPRREPIVTLVTLYSCKAMYIACSEPVFIERPSCRSDWHCFEKKAGIRRIFRGPDQEHESQVENRR